MAIGRFLKKILGGGPSAPQRQYEETDQELQQMWRDRARLNAAEVGALALEFAIRGLAIQAPRPMPRPTVVGPTMLPQTLVDMSVTVTGDVVEVLGGARVLVRLPSGTRVGVALPTWWPGDGELAAADPAWQDLDASIDWSEVEAGYTASWGDASARAVRLGEGGESGESHESGEWSLLLQDGDTRVLVGPSIPLGLIADEDGRPSHVAGSIAPPTAAAFSAAQEAWSEEVSESLLGAWVVADAAKAAPLWSQTLLETLGFATFFCAQRLPCSPLLQPIVAAAWRGDEEGIRSALRAANDGEGDAAAVTALAASGWLLVHEGHDLESAGNRVRLLIDVAETELESAPELMFARGELAWTLSDKAAAATHYQAAADAGYGRGWVNLASLSALDGDMEAASAFIDKAVAALSDTLEHAETGDVTEVLHHPAALHLLTTIRWAQGDREAAFEAMQRALPEQSVWSASLLEALVDEGRPGEHTMPISGVRMGVKEALVCAAFLVHRNGGEQARKLASDLLHVVVQRQHPPFEASVLLADILVAEGSPTEAMDLLQTALETAPLSSELYGVLGEVAGTAGRSEVAVTAWRRAFALAPEDLWLRINAAIVAVTQGQDAAADELIGELAQDLTDPRLVSALKYHRSQD